MKEKSRKIFNLTVEIVFGIILVFLVLGIAIGAFQLFSNVWMLLRWEGISGHYIDIIADVLTLYVLVELSRSLVEYFDSQRLRLTFIVDAGIVFILREILIGLFKHEVKPDMLYALSALVLVLGAVRTASVLVYQREKRLSLHVKE